MCLAVWFLIGEYGLNQPFSSIETFLVPENVHLQNVMQIFAVLTA